MGVLQLVVPAGKGHVIGPGELVAKVVAGAGLEGLAVLHHGFDGVGGFGAGELFLLSLAAGDHGDGQSVPAEVHIAVQLLFSLGDGFLSGLMDGVAFLPPEFTAAEEGAGGLFPADDAAPLVVQHGQLTPGVEHMCPVVTEHSLGSGADGQPFFQRIGTAGGDPSHFGSEAVDQLAFLFQQAFGDEQGHGHVHVTGLLKHPVHDVDHVLPDGVAIGAHDHEALDAGVVHHLRLQADVRIPLGKVFLHGGDLFDLFLILFCHSAQSTLFLCDLSYLPPWGMRIVIQPILRHKVIDCQGTGSICWANPSRDKK